MSAAAAIFVAAAIVFGLVDPRGDFGTGIFPLVVRDTRAEKMQLFDAYQQHQSIDGLVIGSSRSMKLAPSYLAERTGLRFFNFGVDNARAEDYLAIERLVREHGASPRLVIIGLDLEALHDDDEPDSEFLKDAAFRRSVGGYDDRWSTLRAYKRAYTVNYARDALLSMRLALGSTRRPRYYFEPDGRLRDVSTEDQRARGEPVFDERLSACLDIYVQRFEKMTTLSSRRLSYLERTIAEVRNSGGRILIWLTPVHPLTIARLESFTRYRKLHREAVAYLERLRATPGVEVRDLSDPDLFGGAETEEWDDCAHPDDHEESRIAARLVATLR